MRQAVLQYVIDFTTGATTSQLYVMTADGTGKWLRSWAAGQSASRGANGVKNVFL